MIVRVGANLLRSMRRFTGVTVVGMALLLAACGGQPDPAARPVTVPPSTPTPTRAVTFAAPETAVPAVTTPPLATATATATPEPVEVTVTLPPSKDNTLYQDDQGLRSNGSGQHFFAGKSAAGSVRRAVIAFPISASVPVGSTITRVSLTLTLSRTQNKEQAVALHRLLADWGEGASDTGGNEGSGAPAGPGDATWTYRSFDIERWSQPGGDFRLAASGDAAPSGPGQYSWDSTTAMVDDVQMWLDHPDDNFGWLLQGNEEESRTTKRFDSRENESLESRPKLTITFFPPTDPVPRASP